MNGPAKEAGRVSPRAILAADACSADGTTVDQSQTQIYQSHEQIEQSQEQTDA